MEQVVNCNKKVPKSRKMSRNTKRRKPKSYEDSSLQNPSPPAVVFTSSEQDQPSVDILTKNLTEFACLADDHGFQLSVNCETRTNVVVYLKKINSSDEVTNKKMIKKLKRLVKKKKHERTMESNMVEWKTSFEQRLQELEQKDKMNDIHKKTVTKALLKEERGYDEDSFFYQSNFELIRSSPHTLDKMAERLSFDDDIMNPLPLGEIVSCKRKRKELLSYFDLLQTDFDDDEGIQEEEDRRWTHIQEEILFWADLCTTFEPTRERLATIAKEMKSKFNLEENVVGTVHAVHIRTGYPRPWFLAVFIVDKIIMLALPIRFHSEEKLARQFSELRIHFRAFGLWSGFKFAAEIPLEVENGEEDEDGYEDGLSREKLYVHIKNEEVYKENGKVVTFIERNFNLQGWHTSSIRSIYNLCYDCY